LLLNTFCFLINIFSHILLIKSKTYLLCPD
jgi:hypothetical protein